MGRRLLITLGVVVALIVAAVVAGGAYTALKAPLTTKPNSNLNPENCSPGPCAEVQGYIIYLSNIRIDNDVVRMTVAFKNSSSSTHAAPEDLVLIDQERRQGSLITDATGCKSFSRHDFSNGETFGPIDVCFRVTDSRPPFTLHWSPDLGAFCCQKDIKIWPS
ncbi:MAG TPA: hypothetical protein VLK30_15120 [Candidatus Limnocylindrales bacterium]|nr:hypothetical protein [Candidatus Limnocylindrales bacterium]